MKHPARYTTALLPILTKAVDGYERVLDPFGGTGSRLHSTMPRAVALEIEPEWASMSAPAVIGNALCLPFADGTFDAIVTSPCYGNRYADHHEARDGSERRSYRHDLGRMPHEQSSGVLHWGPEYRAFHDLAWAECWRVLAWGGRFVLNIKDHIRDKQRQHVTVYHVQALRKLGFTLVRHEKLPTPGMRMGENSHARVDYESVLVFDVPT